MKMQTDVCCPDLMSSLNFFFRGAMQSYFMFCGYRINCENTRSCRTMFMNVSYSWQI